MNTGSWLRRMVIAGAVTALAATAVATVGTPASADTPVVALTVSPATAQPGDTVTVTETVTDNNFFSILQPTAELFSSVDAITSYTTLTSCDAGPGGTCDTVANGDGDPIGYRAVFGSAIGGMSSATATFTLTVDPNSDSAVETLEGDLAGANFDSGVVPGPTLTINAKADLAVALTGSPQLSLLTTRLNFTVTVTNDGPGTAQAAKVTATIPTGLHATSNKCTATSTGTVCAFGPLANGASASATFTVPIGLAIGVPFQFSALRTSSTPTDPNPANDAASVRCTVVSVVLASCN
ncbi:MAG TPA: DUF11 domain-containing protein [Pseudonocardiaceae bacterium]|nr:DUF11 domain-containing protein [Pseudonocardiaceae bacterium]